MKPAARQVLERNVPRLAMSLADLALSLGFSPNSILKMVDEGRLPPPRIWNTRKVWRVTEVDAYLADWPTDRPDHEGGTPDDPDEWRAEA